MTWTLEVTLENEYSYTYYHVQVYPVWDPSTLKSGLRDGTSIYILFCGSSPTCPMFQHMSFFRITAYSRGTLTPEPSHQNPGLMPHCGCPELKGLNTSSEIACSAFRVTARSSGALNPGALSSKGYEPIR